MSENEVPKRIRVTSDGTPWGTKVIDLETGKEIPRIQSLSLDISVENHMVATIRMIVDEIDITANKVEVDEDSQGDG